MRAKWSRRATWRIGNETFCPCDPDHVCQLSITVFWRVIHCSSSSFSFLFLKFLDCALHLLPFLYLVFRSFFSSLSTFLCHFVLHHLYPVHLHSCPSRYRSVIAWSLPPHSTFVYTCASYWVVSCQWIYIGIRLRFVIEGQCLCCLHKYTLGCGMCGPASTHNCDANERVQHLADRFCPFHKLVQFSV